MRALVSVSILLVATMAGCVADEPAPTNGAATTPPPAESAAGRAARLNATLDEMPQFCETEDDCLFWDQDFHEFVVYDLDTYVFDVVIVPPAGASTADNIAASRQAVQAWSDGIEALAAPWLADAFEMNVYAVGIDTASIDAVEDPEIVVVSTAAVGVLGIGLEPVQLSCKAIGSEVLQDHGGHWHGEHYIGAQNCAGTGFTCFALNGAGMDPRGLYDLIAHEVGHCLGAGHVGDALDFRARYAPIEDIMSYQDNDTQVHCVSNLNVRTLEGVYAHLLDRPQDEHLPYGSYHNMSPLDYFQVPCENPPGMEGSDAPAGHHGHGDGARAD